MSCCENALRRRRGALLLMYPPIEKAARAAMLIKSAHRHPDINLGRQ